MIKYLNNILKSVTAVSLVFALLTPAVLNFIHSFEHHKHQIDCDGNHDTHLHEIEFDCSFLQLYTTPQIYDTTQYSFQNAILHNFTLSDTNYTIRFFASTLIGSHSLRGPPFSS